MKDFRFLLNRKNSTKENTVSQLFGKRSADSTIHAAMFSDFFTDIPENMFCTNGMYNNFLEEVIATLGIYGPKETVTIDIYEKTPSREDVREIALLGFRRYVHAVHTRKKMQFFNELAQVSFFALLGIILGIVSIRFQTVFSEYLFSLLQIISSVLLWQFVGYWAFEYAGQKRELDKLKQIGSTEYRFLKWE